MARSWKARNQEEDEDLLWKSPIEQALEKKSSKKRLFCSASNV